MSRPSPIVLKCLLSLALLAGCLPAAMAASTPTLFSMASGKPEVLAQGAQKSWPIKVSEDSAFDAVFQGGMWLPDPAGGRIYAKYQRHVLHANGTWSWIGIVDTIHGAQPVVLTFGKDGGVFGLVPQASGYPLRIVTRKGQTRVVETSAAEMARSTERLRLYSTPDYAIPPIAKGAKGGHPATTESIAAAAVPRADASNPATIDVMVAYTQGFVAEVGSQSLALTRIQNLVDTTNQAYTSSGVNLQIRLVYTIQVDYPDNTSNSSALDDITGIDSNGNPVSIPASLKNIASLRDQYGADLVALFRGYDNATQGGCGVGWLVGGEQTPIVPSQQKPYGYSVVSDGSSGGYFCLDTTFAHELGHNMGSAHDRANANEAGAYSYSYGYLGTGSGGGFSTIMAYGSASDSPLPFFSNPNLSTCLNSPCGVADSSSNSADNAHSLNNTAPLIAQFEPTRTGNPNPPVFPARDDVNGDGRSDLLWRYKSGAEGAFGYWLMDGASVSSTWSIPTSTVYRVAARGDFNGDGYLDLVWTSNRNDVKIWFGNGHSFSGSAYVGTYSTGWEIIGAGDVNGDGKSDLLFRYKSGSRGKFGYWQMDGARAVRTWSVATSTAYHVGATGDFNGDGKLDIAWTSAKRDVKIWFGNGTSFSSSAYAGSFSSGWSMQGAGDVDGDGKADLLFVYQSGSSARFGYWKMNGSKVVKTWSAAFDPAYRVVSTGDFNGDGLLDVVWTSNARDIQLWLGDGNSFSGNTYVRSYLPGWDPIADTP